jgi:Tfp pilus assembly protein PilV
MRHLSDSSTSAGVLRAKKSFGQRGGRCRSAGFTIFEVAMAGFVLAFGIATAIIAMQMGFKALNVARDSTLASQIIQSEIERLRLLPWSKTTGATPEPVDSILELPASETVALTSMFTGNAALGAKFTVTRTVTTDTSRPSDVRYITVTVSWKTYDGRTQTRSFTTMYAKNGLYDYYYTVAST